MMKDKFSSIELKYRDTNEKYRCNSVFVDLTLEEDTYKHGWYIANKVEVTEQNIYYLISRNIVDEFNKIIVYNKVSESEIVELLINYPELKNEFIDSLLRSNSSISDENCRKIIYCRGDGVSLKGISFEKISIYKYVIDKYLSNENLNYLVENFNSISVKDYFLERINQSGLLNFNLMTHCDENTLQYILISEKVSTNINVDFIVEKINNGKNIDSVRKYISLVGEIKDINSVWAGRHPKIENEYHKK